MLTINDIIARIADLADSKGWSLHRLCNESHIAYTDMNKLLRGNKMISLNNLQKICKAFDISLSQFFSFKQSLPDMIKESDWNMLESYMQLDDKYKRLVMEVIDVLAKAQDNEKKENNRE